MQISSVAAANLKIEHCKRVLVSRYEKPLINAQSITVSSGQSLKIDPILDYYLKEVLGSCLLTQLMSNISLTGRCSSACMLAKRGN